MVTALAVLVARKALHLHSAGLLSYSATTLAHGSDAASRAVLLAVLGHPRIGERAFVPRMDERWVLERALKHLGEEGGSGGSGTRAGTSHSAGTSHNTTPTSTQPPGTRENGNVRLAALLAERVVARRLGLHALALELWERHVAGRGAAWPGALTALRGICEDGLAQIDRASGGDSGSSSGGESSSGSASTSGSSAATSTSTSTATSNAEVELAQSLRDALQRYGA